MKITKIMIEACCKAGACKEGLIWISEHPRTVEQLYKHKPSWFFWLEVILSKSEWKAYNATRKRARETYEAAMEQAREAYESAMKPAWKAYDAATKLALIAALKMDGWK